MEYYVRANAKINIGLNIIGIKPENGYHLLDMTMLPISLYDLCIFNTYNEFGDLEIKTNNILIPINHKNIVYKIHKMYYNKTKISPKRLTVFLYKNIPSQAGLGGGSADGAIMLKFLNEMNTFYYSEEELEKISLEIGSDIPFFIKNKPCRVEGTGEKLTVIKNNLKGKIIIVKPNFGVSTEEAYKNFDKLTNKKFANIDKIIDGLYKNDIDLVENNCENQLEQGLLATNKDIIDFRKKLDLLNNYKFFMSGSGSAYFAICRHSVNKEEIRELKAKIKNCEVYICNFL